jgi:phosphatidylglycerophosphatase A
MEKRLNKQIVLFIAQGAYSGRSPFAPGTAGTAGAVLLYLLLKELTPGWYVAACLVTTIIAVWSANEAEKILGKKDHPSIVIDEVAGFLVSMALVPAGWGFITAGFFLFRAFDIMKPFPLKNLQVLKGGMGIVIDDIGAGIYTNIVLQTAAFIISNF